MENQVSIRCVYLLSIHAMTYICSTNLGFFWRSRCGIMRDRINQEILYRIGWGSFDIEIMNPNDVCSSVWACIWQCFRFVFSRIIIVAHTTHSTRTRFAICVGMLINVIAIYVRKRDDSLLGKNHYIIDDYLLLLSDNFQVISARIEAPRVLFRFFF